MPIIRKVIAAGKTSRAVILPKSWFDFYERESGHQINFVAIEVNRELRITPIIRAEGKPKQ